MISLRRTARRGYRPTTGLHWVDGHEVNRASLEAMGMVMEKGREAAVLPFGRDTDQESARILVAAIRRQSLETRAESVAATGRALAHFAMAGARPRFPDRQANTLAYDVDRRRYGLVIADALVSWRTAHQLSAEVARYLAADPFPLLYLVADALEAAGVPFLITGALVSGVYGPPRATNDVDLLARMAPASFPVFVGVLPTHIYADPLMIADAVNRRSSFTIIDPIAGAKVAVFVSDESPITRAQFDRARTLALGPASRPLPIISAEGIVLAKLVWYRAGGEVSEQQWRDIAGVLTISGPEFDRVWLEHWATRLGVRDLLTRVEAQL